MRKFVSVITSGVVSATLTAAFVAALLLAAAPQSAHAQVTGYNSLTAFNAAATTSAVYDFEGIAQAGNVAFNPSVSPLTISITGGATYYVDSATYFSGAYALNGTDSLAGARNTVSNPNDRTTAISLGGSYTAFGTLFGFRVGTFPLPTGAVNVQLFNGATIVGNAFSSAVPAEGAFIGLTSTQAFDRVIFTSTAQSDEAFQQFDDVRVGSIGVAPTAAPEPGTLPLVGMGFVTGLGMARTVRRRKAKSAVKQAA